MTRNGILERAARVSDLFFDRIVRRKTNVRILLALAAPALVGGMVVTVHSGNTLSGLAAQYCHGNASDWTGIYHGNIKVIGANPNLIEPGQKLVIKCTHADPPGYTTTGQPVATGGAYCKPDCWGDGDGDGYDLSQSPFNNSAPASSAPVYSAPNYHNAPAPVTVSASSYSGFQACVISRESGGNSQVMNSTGHYGLYQFSASTWAEYGGSPGSFGNASVAEQNAVFNAAMAAPGGESNWAPYDGC